MAVMVLFINDIEEDEHAGSEADGQTEYIDGGEGFVAAETAECYQEMMVEHAYFPAKRMPEL
jgi:hypothetical protein